MPQIAVIIGWDLDIKAFEFDGSSFAEYRGGALRG
jgi:hypothetical protein